MGSIVSYGMVAEAEIQLSAGRGPPAFAIVSSPYESIVGSGGEEGHPAIQKLAPWCGVVRVIDHARLMVYVNVDFLEAMISILSAGMY